MDTPLQLHTFLMSFTRSGEYAFVCYRNKGKEKKKKNESKTMLALRNLCFQYKFNSELNSLLTKKATSDWQGNLLAIVGVLVEQRNICYFIYAKFVIFHNCHLGDLKPAAY